jgi:hypothetical protein
MRITDITKTKTKKYKLVKTKGGIYAKYIFQIRK